MIRRCYRLSWLIGWLLLVGGSAAHAVGRCPAKPADGAQAKRLATDWWRAGVRLYEIGSYAEAIRTWQCAYRLVPHPLALFNIAKAAQRAGSYELALDYYQRYLETAPGAKAKRVVQVAMEQVRRQIRLRPRTPPRRATGQGAGGNGPRGGRGSALVIAGWSMVGAAGALACLAATFGGLALRAKGQLDGADPGTPWNPDLLRVVHDYDRYRTATWVSVGLGLATLATGTVLLVLERFTRRPSPQAEHAARRLSLQVRRDGVTVTLGGRF